MDVLSLDVAAGAALSGAFRVWGRLCASYASAVLVVTVLGALYVSLASFQLAAIDHGQELTDLDVCGLVDCPGQTDLDEAFTSNVILATLFRCAMVVCIYFQYCRVHRLGSKYLLGIAVAFSVVTSFMFAIAVYQLDGKDIAKVVDAALVYLFLWDKSRMSSLVKIAFGAKDQAEKHISIGNGLATVGPGLAMNTFMEMMVIGMAKYVTVASQDPFQRLCLFGYLSVVMSFLNAVIVFPAVLALFMEFSSPRCFGRGSLQLSLPKVASSDEEEERTKANPVAQNIRNMIALGLAFFHGYSWMNNRAAEEPKLPNTLFLQSDDGQFWQKEGDRLLHGLYADKWLPLLLAMALSVKYIFFDFVKHSPHQLSSLRSGSRLSFGPTVQTLSFCGSPGTDNLQSLSPIGCDTKISDMVDGASDVAVGQSQSSPLSLPEKKEAVAEVAKETNSSSESKRPNFFIGDADGLEQSGCESKSFDLSDPFEETGHVTEEKEPRSLEECLAIEIEDGLSALTDDEILMLLKEQKVKAYNLEGKLNDCTRAVQLRRRFTAAKLANPLAIENLPFAGYDYDQVLGQNCENVIGYMTVPVGIAGPLLLDGTEYYIPLATTEGCLVASLNRACLAIKKSGHGVCSIVTADGMSRAPAVRLPSIKRANDLKEWLLDSTNFEHVKEEFNSTTRYGQLQSIHCSIAGCIVYIRFCASTGDAMGMNMVTKGVEKALRFIKTQFEDMQVLTLSGNFCTDKKPSAVNWILGRGKSVLCEAHLPAAVVKNVLKTDTQTLVELNTVKNLIGSAMAGSIGGCNAHAANLVTAIFLATGQDVAQSGTSSSCLVQMEASGADGEDLHVTCTMPSLETGTVGGGTALAAQKACLKMLGVQGAMTSNPGANSQQLSRIVCASVLAGELNLLAVLASGDLVKSHMRHNRSVTSLSSLVEQVSEAAPASAATS